MFPNSRTEDRLNGLCRELPRTSALNLSCAGTTSTVARLKKFVIGKLCLAGWMGKKVLKLEGVENGCTPGAGLLLLFFTM